MYLKLYVQLPVKNGFSFISQVSYFPLFNKNVF